MSSAFPNAFYVVYSNPLPGREAALERWIEAVHIPDSLAHGLFHSVRRYQALGASRARFLTLWGCEYRDEREALGAVRPVAEKLRAAGRVEGVQEVVFQQFVFRRELTRERADSAAHALWTFHSCWARPDATARFDAWWSANVAGLAAQSAGAARYGVDAPRAKSLALLEGAPAAAQPDAISEPGLPPFGPATPIFVGGSPAPSPPQAPAPTDAQLEAWRPAWAAQWRLLSQRRAAAVTSSSSAAN